MVSEKNWKILEKELLNAELNSDVNELAMSLFMASPKESEDLIADFCRSVMILGWNKETKNIFLSITEYVNLILKDKGKKRKDELSKKIKDELDELVLNYGEQKYSDEPLYQKFVLKKK